MNFYAVLYLYPVFMLLIVMLSTCNSCAVMTQCSRRQTSYLQVMGPKVYHCKYIIPSSSSFFHSELAIEFLAQALGIAHHINSQAHTPYVIQHCTVAALTCAIITSLITSVSSQIFTKATDIKTDVILQKINEHLNNRLDADQNCLEIKADNTGSQNFETRENT